MEGLWEETRQEKGEGQKERGRKDRKREGEEGRKDREWEREKEGRGGGRN